jgi:DNA-binding NarL/FixJ family response regulator
LRILIVDDHAIFRRGLKQILKEKLGKVVVDEAGNGGEVFEQVCKSEYNVIILDISMPGRNGIDVLKQLKSYKSDLQILILSMYPEEQFAVRALKAGAAGYLTKSSKPDELVEAVKTVKNGRKYISLSLAMRLARYIETGDTEAVHEILSDREYEVMCLTASGKKVKQIAAELSLSDKTISTYRARILDKMNMDNIAQLIQYVIKNNILNDVK